MESVVEFLQTYAGFLIHITNAADIWQMGGGAIVIALVVMYIAFYSVKRIIKNLILGYIFLYAAEYIFHLVIEPTAIMITLMALFGPIPIILAAVWQIIMQ